LTHQIFDNTFNEEVKNQSFVCLFQHVDVENIDIEHVDTEHVGVEHVNC
jgi:hypothetical protein